MVEHIKGWFERILADPGPVLNTALYIAALFFCSIIAWWVFNLVVKRFEKKHRQQPFFQKNTALFDLAKRAGHYVILILLAMGILKLFNAPIVEKIFFAFLIILLASFVKTAADHLLSYAETKLAAKTDTRVDDVVLDLFKKFSGVIIYVTAIILVLDLIGLDIMPFIAGAGIAGIAIGFAAKDTLSNLIAGVLLIIDRPFEVGDRIEVWTAPANSATWGDVIHIGLRATKIRTTDNIVIVIPNNEIMRRDIINYTAVTEEIRVRIPIGIAYDADVKKAKAAIIRVCRELDWVMTERPPKVVVKSFGDSAVNLEARVWISDPRRRIDTISHVGDRVKEVFDQEGIEIPYPKRDIYIKSSPAASS